MSLNTLKFIVFLILSNTSFVASSQIPVFEWASNQQFVGIFYERCITTDANENVIFTGYFSGYNDFDPGPADLIIQAVGSTDFYVVKLDPAGNLLWVKTFPSTASPSASNKAYSVVVDSSDNIYVSGSYYGPIDFDPGPGVYNLAPVTAVSLGFLFSLNPNGDFRWARSLPMYGNSLTGTRDMAYSPDGGIIVSDQFSSATDFDLGPGVYQITPSSYADKYVLKLDLDGNFVWARSFEGQFETNYAITTHSSGNIFISGLYAYGADLDPGPGTQNVTPNGVSDAYVVKLNSLGDLIWAKTFNSPANAEPREIDVDAQQNIYISGLFSGTPDFDPGPGTATLTAEGTNDVFLLKLDPNGDFQWVHNYGGSGTDLKMSVCTDPSGNVYATGRYTDTLDFQPGPVVNNQIAAPSASSLFITKLSANSTLDWVKSLDGVGWILGASIHYAPSGNFYVAGEYNNAMDFNPGFGNAIFPSSGSGFDGFNLKYSQCYQSNPIPDLASLPNISSNCTLDTVVAPTAIAPCLGAIVGVPNVTFPITSIGTTIVTWTYDAGNGFVSTQNQTIIIADTESPVPNVSNLPDISFVCSTSTLTPPSATDNCSNTVTVTNDATFPIQANTTVTWTYDDGNGNTSTQTQNVIITTIDNGITQINGATLSAVASGYQYQWVDCDNGNSPFNGATNQTFVATSNGNYAVEVSDGTCTETSNCLTIDEVSLDEIYANSKIFIYPNPSKEWFTISSAEELDVESIQITNELGQKVSFKVKEEKGEIEISIGTEAGIYYLTIDGVRVYKLIKL